MANPFKDLFKSKYTTYYSVDDLNDEQKAGIQKLQQDLSANPGNFTEEEAFAITKLNERLLRPKDPLLSTYESIQDDTTGRGAFQQRRTLEEKRLAVSAAAKERKEYKTSYLYGQVEDYEPKNPLTNVQSVIDQEDVKKEFESKIAQERDNKKQKYTELIGIDPYEDTGKAFQIWMADNPELVDIAIESFPQIKENSPRPFQDLYEIFKKSIDKGTLEQDFYNIEKPKEEKVEKEAPVQEVQSHVPTMPTSGVAFLKSLPNLDKNDRTTRAMIGDVAGGFQFNKFIKILKDYQINPSKENELKLNEFYSQSPTVQQDMGVDVMDWKEALWNIYQNPEDLVMFVKDSKDIKLYVEIGALMHKDSQHQTTGKNPLTPEELEKVEQFLYEEQRPKTEGAQIIEGLAQMAPFMQEFALTYGASAILKKGTKEIAYKALREETLDWAKATLVKRGVSATTKTAGVITKATAMTELGFAQDASYYKNLIPGLEVSEEGERIYSEPMSKKDARRRAKAGTFIEYLSEFSGPATMAGLKKLSLGAKDVVLTESLSKALSSKIKKLYPNLNITDESLDAIRKYVRMTGYDGFFEEMLEERVGEGMRALLQGLSDQGIIDGFEDDFAEGLITDLVKTGNLEQFASGLAVEAGVLIVPGASTRIAAAGRDIVKERKFKKDYSKIAKQRDDIKKLNKENTEEYNTLIEKENLNKKDTKRLKELDYDVKLETAIDQVEKIVKDNPKLKKVVDIEIVDEVVEITSEELESKGKTAEGQGFKGVKKFRILGENFIKEFTDNIKLAISLKRGANFDTALEEFMELIYKGGLSNKEVKAVENFYDRYLEDEKFRKGLNQKINESLPPDKQIDEDSILEEVEFFSKSARAKYYAERQTPKDFIDKIYDGIKNRINKIIGNITLDDEIREIYEKAGAKKVKLSAERAQKLLERREKRKEQTKKKLEEQKVKAEAKEEKKEAKAEAKEAKETKKIEKKRKRLRPGVEPTLDEEFEDAEYEEIEEPEEVDLGEFVPPTPKKVKKRKEDAEPIPEKSKLKIFNFLKRRTKKIVPKKIKKLSPVAIREMKIKIEKEVPKQVIPNDPREPLEILRDILGDEQFQELTGIYTGSIERIEKIDPKIISSLEQSFPEFIASLKKVDVIDLIPDRKQEEILKEVEKVVGKETIKPIRTEKKTPTKRPKKPPIPISVDEEFEDMAYDDIPESILEELPELEKPPKKKKSKKDTSYQIVSAETKENTGTFVIAGDPANLNLKGEPEDFGIRYPRTYKGWAVTKVPATKIQNQIDKGNNIIAITSLSDALNSQKQNPTFVEALKRAVVDRVGKRDFNSSMKRNKDDIYKVATENKVNMRAVGRDVAVPDFNQIASKVVAVAKIEDIRTGEDRKVKHPAYDHEINFSEYRELKEPIPLKDIVGELPEGDKRIDYPLLMAKTYNLAISNKESPTNDKLKEFLETGNNRIFGVKTTGIQVASPQIESIELDKAISSIKSQKFRTFHRFIADIEVEQNYKSTTKASIGEWETGAEPSVYTEITSEANTERDKYIAAAKGLTGEQINILNFEVNEAGNDILYIVKLDLDANKLKRHLSVLSKQGIKFKTLPVTGNKVDLLLVDEGGTMLDLIKGAFNETQVQQEKGNASFIGAEYDDTKSDRQLRNEADKEYLKIITEYEQKNPGQYSKVLRDNISILRPRFDKNLLPKKQEVKPQVSYQLVPADQPLELPDETRMQWLIRRYVNSLNRIDQTVGTIGDVDEMTNAYLEAKLFPGKVSAELEDFNKSIEDFLKRLVEAGFNAESFGEYLYAKHAEERNKKVHEDDPTFEGTGSGMAREDTTLEDKTVVEGYESILKKYRGTGIAKFAVEFTNKVIKKRLRVLRNGGLISQETYDYFTKESPYKFYVPLKGGVDKKVYGQKTKGFSITGKDIQRKRGRNSRALNPFAVAISDYADAVIRAGQNKVSQKLYLLALDNPSNFWSARGKRYIPRYDKNGEIKFFDPASLGANEVQAVVDGKLKVITIEDEALLETFKSFGVEESYKAAEAVNSWLRKAYTTYNPDFILGNFIRDLQTAMVNIQASAPDKKIGRKIFKDVMSGGPMRAIYRSIRDKDIGSTRISLSKKKLGMWNKYYEEMRKEGATVGWFTNRKVGDLLKELDGIIKRHQSRNPMFVIRAMGKLADDFNMAIEQATRLAAYKNLREAGYSKAEAAKATRDLTVDFNQKGQKGALFRVSYLFSNASMQGVYILANSLKNRSAQKMVMAITMQSFLLSIINSMLMDDPDADDPEDKYPWTDGIPDYEKDSYIIYPLPNGKMFKLQIGWGLNIFHTLGNLLAEGVIAQSRGRKPKYSNSIKRAIAAFANAASPIGYGTSLSSIAPTIFGTKPLWEIIDNKKFTGAPIANIYDWEDRPASQETFPGVNPYTKQATDWISRATGGKKYAKAYEKGSVEINPEWIDHIMESWGGGPYRTSRNLYTTGYDLYKFGRIKSIKSVPLARKLLTEPTAYAVTPKMYDMLNSSSYTKFSESERDDFKRYIKILINSDKELLKETVDKKEKGRISKRIEGYVSKNRKFHRNQGKLK